MIDDTDEMDNDDDLISAERPSPGRRVTGKQVAVQVASPFRGPLVTILVAALSTLVTAAVVKSCGGCVSLGTWSPPYQSAETAAVEKKANLEDHAAIRTDVSVGLGEVRTEIQTSQREIIKAITAAQKSEERRRPR